MIEKINDNCIVFSTDDNYIEYTLISLKSLFKTANREKKYDIVILYKELNETNRNRLLGLNFDTIRIYDVTEDIKNCSFVLSNTLTETTYYRCFIPEIFKEYEKVVYLDSDILIKKDIDEIFNSYIGNCMVGVIPLVLDDKYLNTNTNFTSKRYFNACVLLFNIKACLERDFVKKCLNMINSGKKYEGNDNDIICSVCFRDNVVIDNRWCYNNVVLKEEPWIVHFIGNKKPWIEQYKDLTKYSVEWNELKNEVNND